MDIVIGTAGHIDHGKTSLIKTLTGKDTDRLPEEKSRGITIDLGFAEFSYDGIRFGVVDVPGHEKFIRNMLAGASGVDLLLLVVAANEGVMPQTREHFDICRLLGIKKGLVVLTKCDATEDGLVELVEEDVKTLVKSSFLEHAPIIKVSSLNGEGIQDLKTEIAKMSRGGSPRDSGKIMRLPVDRSFALKGFGTIVTGTLIDGEIDEGDSIVILPKTLPVKVRGLHVHGASQKKVDVTQRVAVNVSGVGYTEVSRGDVLTNSKHLRPTQTLDCYIEILESFKKTVKSRNKLRFYSGTKETIGRVYLIGSDSLVGGESGYAQIRLDSPVIVLPGDRLILRSHNLEATLGGGEVLHNSPAKYRKKFSSDRFNFLRSFHSAGLIERILLLIKRSGGHGLSIERLKGLINIKAEMIEALVTDLCSSNLIVRCEQYLVGTDEFKGLKENIFSFLSDFLDSNKSEDGAPLLILRERFWSFEEVILREALESLKVDGVSISKDRVGLVGRSAVLGKAVEEISQGILERLGSAGLNVPRITEISAEMGTDQKEFAEALNYLLSKKRVIKVSEELYFESSVMSGLFETVINYASSTEDRRIDVSIFKSLTGVSRKYAIPLLEYMDNHKITVRAGDSRIVIKKAGDL